MAAPIDTTIGFLGLAGLLSDCIQHFETVHLDRHNIADHEIIGRDFHAQRARLVVWGMATGIIGEQDYEINLDQPHVYPAVHGLLTSIKILFEMEEYLAKKYGLEPPNPTFESTAPSSASGETDEKFLLLEKQDQSDISFKTTARWIASDVHKFRQFVEDLRDSIDALQDLTESSGILTRQCEITRKQINDAETRGDGEAVAILQEAAPEIFVVGIQDEKSQRHHGHSKKITASEATDQAAEKLAYSIKGNSSQEPIISSLPIRSRTRDVDEAEAPTTLSSSDPIPPCVPAEVEAKIKIVRYNEFTYGQVISPDASASLDQKWTQLITEDLEQLSKALKTPNLVARLLNRDPHPLPSDYSTRPRPSASWKRLKRELKNWVSNPDIPFISISPLNNNNNNNNNNNTTTDLSSLLCIIRGPPQTPYHGGIFFLRMHIPIKSPTDSYPFKPITCQFLTKIYHPNIDESGRIGIFSDETNWSPIFNPVSVLVSLSGLLSAPMPEDAVRMFVGAQFLCQTERFERIAAGYTSCYANGERPVMSTIEAEGCWWDYAQAELPLAEVGGGPVTRMELPPPSSTSSPTRDLDSTPSSLSKSWTDINSNPTPSPCWTERSPCR